MKKEIRFSSVIDTKEFDRAIQEMQKKLQSVYQASDRSRAQLEVKQAVSQVGLGRAPTVADKARADQEDRKTRRELDNFIREQVKQQENLGKAISKQMEDRKKLLQIAKDDLKAKEKLLDLEKQISTNREKMKLSEEATMRALNERRMPGFNGEGGFIGAMQRGAAAFRGAGIGGSGFGGQIAAGAVGFNRGVASMGPLGMMSLLGSVGIAGVMGANVASAFNQAPREILSAQGSVRSIYGQGARDVVNRQGLEQTLYAPEIRKALEDSKKEIDKQKSIDNVSLGMKILAGVGVGAGAALTATGLGASVGIPLIAGSLAAGGATFAAMGGPEDVKGRVTGTYASQMEERRAAAFQQNLEARKNLDPVRRAVIDRYQQELMPNLSAQRMTGMGDEDMISTLLAGTRAGFTTDLTRQAMGDIIGAGGSTRAARDNANSVNALQRNFNLTNAGTAMGRVSGLTTGSGEANASMVKVMAEAVSIGLDDSQFAEEQRRFVDMSTEIISRSGAIDGNQRGVAEGFSKFVAGTNMFQVQGARKAYEVTEALSGEAGGARGAIQAAALNRDPAMKNLNRDQRNMLLQLTNEQLEAGGPMVEGMAATAGLSKEDFVKKAKEIKRGAQSTRADIDRQAQKLKDLDAAGKKDSPEYKEAASKYLSGMGYDVGAIAKMTPADQEAFIQGNVLGRPGATTEQEVQTSLKMEEGPIRAADKMIAGQAAGDQAFMETMKNFTGQVDTANQNLIKFSQEIVTAARSLKQISETDMQGLADASKKLSELYSKIGVGPQGKDLVQPKGAPKGE